MNDNEIKLSIEVNKLLKKIIKYQNIELIKTISRDYNRNEKVLLEKYKKGQYN